jgi:hypothetical protein
MFGGEHSDREVGILSTLVLSLNEEKCILLLPTLVVAGFSFGRGGQHSDDRVVGR